MGIKLKVDDKDKKVMGNLEIEFRVLNNLTIQRKAMMDKKAVDILIANGLDPKLYALSFLAAKDDWEALLKPGALTIPAPGTNLKSIKEN